MKNCYHVVVRLQKQPDVAEEHTTYEIMAENPVDAEDRVIATHAKDWETARYHFQGIQAVFPCVE